MCLLVCSTHIYCLAAGVVRLNEFGSFHLELVDLLLVRHQSVQFEFLHINIYTKYTTHWCMSKTDVSQKSDLQRSKWCGWGVSPRTPCGLLTGRPCDRSSLCWWSSPADRRGRPAPWCSSACTHTERPGVCALAWSSPANAKRKRGSVPRAVPAKAPGKRRLVKLKWLTKTWAYFSLKAL